MDEELLRQLLGHKSPTDPYGFQFFSLPTDARLETLKQRQSGAQKRGEELDPVGQSLLALLEKRVLRERQGEEPLTSATQQRPEPTPEQSLLQRLQQDPLAPLKTPLYQR